MTRRMTLLALAAVVVAVAVAAIVAVNVLLLGSASSANDPVGGLGARAHLPAAPAWTVRPVHGEIENDGTDD
jgi:hypothetical protein